jgi:hypothetical protein
MTTSRQPHSETCSSTAGSSPDIAAFAAGLRAAAAPERASGACASPVNAPLLDQTSVGAKLGARLARAACSNP